MDIGWGEPTGSPIEGLDIVGVRGLDQSMEADLVVGVTTISQRARYLTVLPWALGEFFAADRDAEASAYDPERLKRYLFRVQHLVLACTMIDPTDGHGGGALGSGTHAAAIHGLRRGAPMPFPENARGAMLGTYLGPCRALGLLRRGDGPRPYVITERGRAIWEARNAVMASGASELLADAVAIAPEAARSLAPDFSLKTLASATHEATLLREALTTPWTPGDPDQARRVAEAYGRFAGTLAWLLGEAEHGLDADDLLDRQWRRAVSGAVSQDSTQTAWAEFEGRRRLHYALELMLSAVSRTLDEVGAASIPELTEVWLTQNPNLSDLTLALWPEAANAAEMTGAEAAASVPADLGLDGLETRAMNNLDDAERPLVAFAIAAAVARQSRSLRRNGHFRSQERAGEWALAIIDQAGGEPFDETLAALAEVAARAHLATTFRKMEGGQGCSLRFFPEGPRLRPTGVHTGAGRSGPRLGNVIRIFQDVGVEGLGAGA